MKNILITAGGTVEPIDNIRSITNTGTGKLGRLIADEFAKSDEVDKVFYIHSVHSYVPNSDKAVLIPVQSTDDLLNAVNKLFAGETVDAVIHSMAVSDYRVASVVSADIICKSAELCENGGELMKAAGERDLRSAYNKLPSSLKNPVVLLEQTPKILPLFRKLVPSAKIVGFKLLDGVTHESLIDTAYRLLHHNSCDYVLANDYTTVAAGNHIGYLVDKDKNEVKLIGKENIAQGIAKTVLNGGK